MDRVLYPFLIKDLLKEKELNGESEVIKDAVRKMAEHGNAIICYHAARDLKLKDEEYLKMLDDAVLESKLPSGTFIWQET